MDKMSHRFAIAVIGILLIISLVGCEAFVRKFTRKPKKEQIPREEMVLEPEEFVKPQLTREEEYRQWFLYWQSWHDELIESLLTGTNHKKQIDSAKEALGNLLQLRGLLTEAKQKELDTYLNQLKDLQDAVAKDVYCNNLARNRSTAERLKRNILRNFSYQKVKDALL